MKKILTAVALCGVASAGFAQTAAQLIGKWQLVGYKDETGKVIQVEREFGTKNIYQVFTAPNGFKSILGSFTSDGTLMLSPDGKVLSITTEDNDTIRFAVKSFTATSRVIHSDELGTLTYEKR